MIDKDRRTFSYRCQECGKVVKVVLIAPFSVGEEKPEKCSKCGGTKFEREQTEVITK